MAQDVEAFQDSGKFGSTLHIAITARAGIDLGRIETAARQIINAMTEDLQTRELQRARNHIVTATVDAIQAVGGFGGKADRLNHYYFYTGDADFLARDL